LTVTLLSILVPDGLGVFWKLILKVNVVSPGGVVGVTVGVNVMVGVSVGMPVGVTVGVTVGVGVGVIDGVIVGVGVAPGSGIVLTIVSQHPQAPEISVTRLLTKQDALYAFGAVNIVVFESVGLTDPQDGFANPHTGFPQS
jgi:hypothetical protein